MILSWGLSLWPGDVGADCVLMQAAVDDVLDKGELLLVVWDGLDVTVASFGNRKVVLIVKPIGSLHAYYFLKHDAFVAKNCGEQPKLVRLRGK